MGSSSSRKSQDMKRALRHVHMRHLLDFVVAWMGGGGVACILFLVHRSRRLKFTIVITSIVRPSLTFYIFDFSSETAEPNLTKLDRKQDLSDLYHVCFFSGRLKKK